MLGEKGTKYSLVLRAASGRQEKPEAGHGKDGEALLTPGVLRVGSPKIATR